jgi:DDE superfamily endonuclease
VDQVPAADRSLPPGVHRETWTKTNMAPLRGWAPRGQRIKAKVPHGRWQTMTFLAALRHDRITAPWLIDGPINGEAFLLYVEKVLVPTLRPGDIVIMDNLGSHKGNAVRRAKLVVRATSRNRPRCASTKTRARPSRNRCGPGRTWPRCRLCIPPDDCRDRARKPSPTDLRQEACRCGSRSCPHARHHSRRASILRWHRESGGG